MLNISLPACTKVELWDLTVCIVVNGEKFRSRAVTLTVVRQSKISNLSEIFSYTTRYFNFMILVRLLFELWCKNTETHTHTLTRTHTHKDTDKYSYRVNSPYFGHFWTKSHITMTITTANIKWLSLKHVVISDE